MSSHSALEAFALDLDCKQFVSIALLIFSFVARSSDGHGWCADDDTMSSRLNSNLAGDNFANDKERTPLNVLKKDKVDPLIHAEYFHSGGATTLILSWMEQAPSVQSRRALNHPLEHVLAA